LRLLCRSARQELQSAHIIDGAVVDPYFGIPLWLQLNKEINTALGDDVIKARLAELGATVLAGSPADFGKLVADETERSAKVVEVLGR